MNQTPADAFRIFAKRCLIAGRGERFATLANTEKGQRKVIEALCHDIEWALHPDAVCERQDDPLWNERCFAFHDSVGFGQEFATVREAYDQLNETDSWLIILADGSTGIHRPERWDDEKLVRR